MTVVRAFFMVVGLIVMLVGLLFALLTLGVFPGTRFLGPDFAYLVNNYTYTALGLLILLVGVLFIALAASGRSVTQKEAQAKEGGSIVSFTEIGEVRISFKAIESMVLAAARKVNGIREVTTRIDAVEQGLIIYMRVKTIPDMPIPGLAAELQTKVRDYVQQNSGTNISEVKVLVENIAQDKIQRSPR
jgi:uncharacterized alkaline shock family protein YloU